MLTQWFVSNIDWLETGKCLFYFLHWMQSLFVPIIEIWLFPAKLHRYRLFEMQWKMLPLSPAKNNSWWLIIFSSKIRHVLLNESAMKMLPLSLFSCPTRWSLYWPLALCVDHLSLSILSKERKGTAKYYPYPWQKTTDGKSSLTSSYKYDFFPAKLDMPFSAQCSSAMQNVALIPGKKQQMANPLFQQN